MAILALFKKTAAFHSVRQISLIALSPLRFPGFNPTASSYPGSRQHFGEFDKVLVNFALSLSLSRAMFADGLSAIKITK